jgi:hypothetical protein
LRVGEGWGRDYLPQVWRFFTFLGGWAVLGVEPRAKCLLDRCSTLESSLQPSFLLFQLVQQYLFIPAESQPCLRHKCPINGTSYYCITKCSLYISRISSVSTALRTFGERNQQESVFFYSGGRDQEDCGLKPTLGK